MKKCQNAEPGTYNHECSKPAHRTGGTGNSHRSNIMSTHTPGPWDIGPMEGNQGVRIWQTDNDKNVKAIIGFVIQRKPSRELDAETEANARLIAAAPDMLAALKNMLDNHEDGYGEEAAEQARAAINKATQEPTA